VWNLGEENTNSPEQTKACSRYIHQPDPYGHPVVMHTNATPEHHEKRYGPLLGYKYFDGASMQIRDDELVNPVVADWIKRSGEAGHQWVVTFDEQRTGATGVEPDAVDEWHAGARYRHLWSTLLAGGAGIEWYFGYNYQHDDLTCEDWRTRDNLWEITRIALDFMREHVPFTEMEAANELTRLKDDYAFAKPGETYVIYVPAEERRSLRLFLNFEKLRDRFTVEWFNPRTGGELQTGSTKQVRGPGWTALGQPPADRSEDWVALVKKVAQ
ncbi:MAG: DUF5060 domain-containing protein, partial [bacterium]|nr:DUF5060 domain-containing protein [bacterium]